jgi:ribosomal protein L37AE/L43A
VDEYLTQMEKAPAKVAMAARDECPRCDVPHKLRLCAHKSIMTCPSCGYALSYLDATSSSTSFDEVVEYSQYSYKRVNHYMMWLSLVQGKEAHRVPEDILRAVAVDLHDRQRVRTVEEITQKRVRASLRKLRLRKAYDHVAQVTARLSGRRPPQLSREVEEQLRNMFLQMQPVFQKHAPSSRTNFLSYSYVLYRCFQILGRHDMLEGITLLKGRDKLEANDLIFRNMCEDLGWPVYELPPASETTGG